MHFANYFLKMSEAPKTCISCGKIANFARTLFEIKCLEGNEWALKQSHIFYFFKFYVIFSVSSQMYVPSNALCNKSNGRCDIKAEKREELESKSSHKSDIWPPAASKKCGEIY